MNKKLLTVVLAGTVFTMALLPVASMAGNGRGGVRCLQNKTKCTLHTQVRQQFHDGSCLTSGTSGAGAAQKKGKTYGPGDGTGNQSVGPQDGTGNGAPSNQ